MTTHAIYHTATLLPNGKVLVAGGSDGLTFWSSAELYDPATGLWTATGRLTTHAAFTWRRCCQTGRCWWPEAETKITEFGRARSFTIRRPGCGRRRTA